MSKKQKDRKKRKLTDIPPAFNPKKAKTDVGDTAVSDIEGLCARCETLLQGKEIAAGLQVMCFDVDNFHQQFTHRLTQKYKQGNVYLIFHFIMENKDYDLSKVVQKEIQKAENEAKSDNLIYNPVLDTEFDKSASTLFVTIKCPACSTAIENVEEDEAETVICLHMDVAIVNGKMGGGREKEKIQLPGKPTNRYESEEAEAAVSSTSNLTSYKTKRFKQTEKAKVNSKEHTKENKAKRMQYISEFTNRVCALRNSGGGIIIIHLLGRHPDDFYIGYFDEMVEDSLKRLLNPGEIFCDQFSRERYILNGCLFIRFRVAQSSLFSTGNFKTKLPLDYSIIDPGPVVISNILSKETLSEINPVFQGDVTEGNYEDRDYHEDRHLEIKQFYVGDQEGKMSTMEVSNIIWNQLKLGENITAFTKNEKGGTYFCGIGEKEENRGRYKTRVNRVYGISLASKQKRELENALRSKINDEMTAINNQYTEDKSFQSRISVAVKYLRNGNCIVEVKVSHFPGLVFYDNKGPESYRFDGKVNYLRRLTLKEWCVSHKQHFPGKSVCTSTGMKPLEN